MAEAKKAGKITRAGGAARAASTPAVGTEVKDKIRESLLTKAQDDDGRGAVPPPEAAPAAQSAVPWDTTPAQRSTRRRPTPEEVSTFLRQLSTMLGAGIPLMRSLQLLEKRAHTVGFRHAVGAIIADLERGTQFWTALQRHPEYFDRLVVNVVRTGEESGSLVTVIDYIARYRDHEADMKRAIQRAVIYPLLALVVAIAVVLVLVVFVIPQFAAEFHEANVELPLITKLVIGASDGMRIFFLGIFVVAGFFLWVRRHAVWGGGLRRVVDEAWLRSPIFGNILTKVYVVQSSTMLSILLRAGLPLLRALDLVRDTMTNTLHAEAFADIRENVERGRSLQESFQRHRIFPEMVTDMVAVGEESGSLPEVMDQVAATYQKEVDYEASVVGQLLEPVLLAFMGVVVLFVALAMFIPYLSLITTVRG